MCHQILAEVEIALCNEGLGMAFAARAGLNTQEAFDAGQNSDGWSWVTPTASRICWKVMKESILHCLTA